MQNPTNQDSYEELRKRAETFYIKIERVWSPALSDHVIFKRSGFQHLIWKGGRPRPKSEQKRRFYSLIHVEKIISNPDARFLHEQRGNAQFWTFTENRGGKIIKVIIQQIGEGKKHFLSVFEKNKKSPNKE